MKIISQFNRSSLDPNFQIITKSNEKNRKKRSEKIADFYFNNTEKIKEHICDLMKNSSDGFSYVLRRDRRTYERVSGNKIGLFGEETIQTMPKPHFRLLQKILNNICTVYDYGIDRFLTNADGTINREETDNLLEIYKEAGMHVDQTEIYRQGWLFQTILVQPVFRDGSMCMDIWTPNNGSVISTAKDKYVAGTVYIEKQRLDSTGSPETFYEVWSNEQHYIINSQGIMESVEGNDKKENPYKIIPHATLRFLKGDSFWTPPMMDLVEHNMWFDIRKGNEMFVEFFQGLGVGIAINTGRTGEIAIKPNYIIAVENKEKDTQNTDLKFASTNSPMEKIRDNIDAYYKHVGNSNGLSSSTFDNAVKQMSGIAKQFDNEEMEVVRNKQKEILIQFEKDLFNRFKAVWNYESKSYKNKKLKPISDDLEFVCQFIKPKPFLTVKDEITQWEFDIKNDFATKVDYMIAKNPNLTTKRAEEILKENMKTNKTFSMAKVDVNAGGGSGKGGGTPFDPNNQDPSATEDPNP